MKTYRPPYMDQTSIQVFQFARIDSGIVFTISLGEEVEVLEENIIPVDTVHFDPFAEKSLGGIKLCKVRYDGKEGYINQRWLK